MCSRQQRNQYINGIAVIICLHPPSTLTYAPPTTEEGPGSLQINILRDMHSTQASKDTK